MPHSMTGFSTAETRVGSFRLVWEIRSVNHRYLELGFRLPDELRGVEPECREMVAAALKRGKVLSKEKLDELGGKWGRYADVDGDGIPWRTLPGTDHPMASYFTRGSGHNERPDSLRSLLHAKPPCVDVLERQRHDIIAQTNRLLPSAR